VGDARGKRRILAIGQSLSANHHGQFWASTTSERLIPILKALNPPRKTTLPRPTHASPSSSNHNTIATTTAIPVPPELEKTLGTLTSHRSVLGYLLIARGGTSSASIIRNSGVVFEGEKGRKYASVIAKIVESVQAGLEEVNNGMEDSSETVRFWRRL